MAHYTRLRCFVPRNDKNLTNFIDLMNLTNLITIFFSFSLWMRIARQIFEKSEKRAFIYTSIYSLWWVIFITIITLLSQYLVFNTTQVALLFTILISSTLSLPFQKSWISWQLIQTCITMTIALITPGSLSHYITASRSEESLKRANIKNYTSWPLSKIILLCIISGIVFGASETIIYSIVQLFTQHTISSAVNIISQRSFIPLILHSGTVIISCLIAYNLTSKINTIFAWIIWLISWIIIHFIFNISNIYGYIPIIVLIIIGCILAISYGFFRSDTIYISKDLSSWA